MSAPSLFTIPKQELTFRQLEVGAEGKAQLRWRVTGSSWPNSKYIPDSHSLLRSMVGNLPQVSGLVQSFKAIIHGRVTMGTIVGAEIIRCLYTLSLDQVHHQYFMIVSPTTCSPFATLLCMMYGFNF